LSDICSITKKLTKSKGLGWQQRYYLS
jgi:hypothetical protein